MAITSTTVWEVETGGDDTNAGGFNPSRGGGGVDHSLSTSPHVVIDGATITFTLTVSTTIGTVAGYTVHAEDLGNLVRITGGTMTAGIYEIIAVNTGSNRWTIDRSGGTNTQTGTGRMGGCLATPGMLPESMVSGNLAWIKAGTYTMSTSTPGAGGPVAFGNGAWTVECYSSTRGDKGTATLHCGAQTSVVAFTMTSTSNALMSLCKYLIADGNSGSGNNGFLGYTGHTYFIGCQATGFNNTTSEYGFTTGTAHECLASSCGTGFNIIARSCVATTCNVGFVGTTYNCIAYGNTSHGVSAVSNQNNTISYGNGGSGFNFPTSNATAIHQNCISVNNTSYGYGGLTTSAGLINCAHFGNSAPTNGTPRFQINTITLTADPFVNSAASDFRLNTTAGGGAACRGVALTIPGQTDTKNIGAIERLPVYPDASEVLESADPFGDDGLISGTLPLDNVLDSNTPAGHYVAPEVAEVLRQADGGTAYGASGGYGTRIDCPQSNAVATGEGYYGNPSQLKDGTFVQLGPHAKLTATGATGDYTGANGDYVYDGEYDGIASWTNGTYYLWWYDGSLDLVRDRWYISTAKGDTADPYWMNYDAIGAGSGCTPISVYYAKEGATGNITVAYTADPDLVLTTGYYGAVGALVQGHDDGAVVGAAAQKVTDAAFLETNKDEIIVADTDIEAEFGVTGTAAGGGVASVRRGGAIRGA